MSGIAEAVYSEVDPEKKDAAWFSRVVEIHRMYWRPLVDANRAYHNRNLMLSLQEIETIKESFQDEDFKKHVRFLPLPIFENLINSIVEEITKNPPRTEVKATDPSAINMKKDDLLLLKRRSILEGDLSKYQQQVGLPEYKIPYDKFEGNIEEFDRMGLNERDPEDITFYSEHFQRLWYEIAGQSVLDNVMKTNRFDQETLRQLVQDVFALKTVSIQVYVDKITGEIKTKYIDPVKCRGVFGTTNDGKNDIARGWEDTITVMEWLQLVGGEFDWKRDWRQALHAINYSNYGLNYTGFLRGGVTYCMLTNGEGDQLGFPIVKDHQPNLLDWNSAFGYKVSVGYIECRTPEATGTFIRSSKDPDFSMAVPYSYQVNKKKEVKEYFKEVYYQQQWYSSYFIATTKITQWVFGFQKVYYQQLEGANDEYSNGTLCYYQEKGKSAVEIGEVYVQPATFAFYRMLWLIYKAKPEEDQYLMEELIQLAKGFQREFPQQGGAGAKPASLDSILTQIIQMQRKSHIRIRTFPQINGQTIGQLPPDVARGTGGLDPIAISMQAVTQWAESQVAIKIGMNQMRFGGNPPSRESNDTEQQILASSYNTTGYMYRMLQFLKEHMATTMLNYAQDIIKFKDSVPYKWLLNLIGNESFGGLAVLDKFVAHRMGIFVDDYNRNLDRNRVIQAADMSLAKGTITQDQWFIITQTADPKRANAILSRLLKEKEKRDRAFQQQMAATQEQYAQAAFERQMQLLQVQGQIDMQKAQIPAQATVQAAQLNADSRVQTKMIQVENEPVKQDAKTQGQKDILVTKENLAQQAPMTDAA